MFNQSDIRLLYLRELRSALRQRNIVVNSILVPIFLYPVLLWLVYSGIMFVSGQTEGLGSRIMLAGLVEEHNELKLELERDEDITLVSTQDPTKDIRDGALDLLAEFLPPEPGTASADGNFQVLLRFDNSKDRSSIARRRVEEIISDYRERYLEEQAENLGISLERLQQFWIQSENVATSREMGQFLLGLMLPLFLIIMLSIGSMHPAIDSTAGEREKSTWETLMTVATARGNIIIAKYLYVATMASVAGLLNLAAMLLSMRSVMAPLLGHMDETFSFRIPLFSIPLIMMLTVLLALFVSAGMMILASFARTFKEGQSMVSPFYLAVLLPVFFLQVPGLKLTPMLALMPVVNVALAFREAISGTFQWPLIGITVVSEVLCIAGALWLATTILRYEDFLLGSYSGSFGKFLKERVFGKAKQGGTKHD